MRGSMTSYLFEISQRYMKLAKAFDSIGDRARADAYWALAVVYKLAPKWQEPNVPRGKYFQPSGFTESQQEREMVRLRKSETLTWIKFRLVRISNCHRKARIADVLWEFGQDASSARIAIDFYARAASDGIYVGAPEADAYVVSAYLGRAMSLSRAINDAGSREGLLHLIYDGFEMMVHDREIFALTLLINSLLCIDSSYKLPTWMETGATRPFQTSRKVVGRCLARTSFLSATILHEAIDFRPTAEDIEGSEK